MGYKIIRRNSNWTYKESRYIPGSDHYEEIKDYAMGLRCKQAVTVMEESDAGVQKALEVLLRRYKRGLLIDLRNSTDDVSYVAAVESMIIDPARLHLSSISIRMFRYMYFVMPTLPSEEDSIEYSGSDQAEPWKEYPSNNAPDTTSEVGSYHATFTPDK